MTKMVSGSPDSDHKAHTCARRKAKKKKEHNAGNHDMTFLSVLLKNTKQNSNVSPLLSLYHIIKYVY